MEEGKKKKSRFVLLLLTPNINKTFLAVTLCSKNIILGQDIKKHLQNKNKVKGKQEAAIACGEVEVVLLLGGWEVPADHQYCRESGADYLPLWQQLRAEKEEAKGSGM